MNTQVTLSSMQKNQLNPSEQVLPGFNSQQGFELMQRQARMLAASTLIPQQYRDNLPNCVIALNMASRLGADPLLIMQNLYVVHGTPGWSAKFLIASFNQCGRFSAIRYEWQGKQGNKNWGCRAWAVEKISNERVESPWITWELVEAEGWSKKNGSKWKTMPEKMFMYRSAAWLVDTVAPEISMGLQSADQIQDTYDTEMNDEGIYTVTKEDLKQAEPEPQKKTTKPKTNKAEVVDIEPEPPTGEISQNLAECLGLIDLAKNHEDLEAAAVIATQKLSIDEVDEFQNRYEIREEELKQS